MARKAPTPSPTVVLTGDLDVFSIHPQWERMLPLLGVSEGTVELDLTGIGDLDLSGMQLLWTLDRDLKAKGARLALRGLQEEWQARFRTLGLADIFAETPS